MSAPEKIASRFAGLYPDEVAEMIEPLDPEEIAEGLEAMPDADAAAVLGRFSSQVAADVLGNLSDPKARAVLAGLEPTQAAALLGRLPDQTAARLLEGLRSNVRREFRILMDYPADSAGRLMDPRVMTFRPETNVDQALGRLRGVFPRRIFDVFLIDREGVLIGSVGLQDIATAPPGTLLADISRSDTPRVRDTATREEVVEELEGQKMIFSLPVVDFGGRVVGVIRYGSLLETLEHVATDDIQTMVGVSREERALSRIGFVVRKRLPWLHVNLVTALLAASVVSVFEETIARFTALAVLMPLVAGMSGNTGQQALAVIMRGLSLREITPRHAVKVLVKEVSAGFINSIAIATVTAAAVLLWSGSPGLAGVSAAAMILSMASACLAGASIPLVLQTLGQDPAQSSSIFLTTVTDVVGFFSFLGLATVFAGFL